MLGVVGACSPRSSGKAVERQKLVFNVLDEVLKLDYRMTFLIIMAVSGCELALGAVGNEGYRPG